MRGRRAIGTAALVICLVAVAWAAGALVRTEARAAPRVEDDPESSIVSAAAATVTVPALTGGSPTSAPRVLSTPSATRSTATGTSTTSSPASTSNAATGTTTTTTASRSITAGTPIAAGAATTSSTPTSSRTATTSESPSAPEPRTPFPAETIAAAVDDAVQDAADEGLVEHVVVADRATGAIKTAIDADATVPSMSLFKLFIATDVLVRNGGIGQLDVDNQQNLWTMITRSDDEIAQDYYDRDGGNAIVERTIERYQLTDTAPTPEPQYWGDVQISARDMASFLQQALAAPLTGPWLESAMAASADTGDDGFDQDFGMNAIDGAGSKQGWGCCLGGVMAIHSVGFTADQIVVVLSTSEPDARSEDLGTAQQLADDQGAQQARAAITRIARMAVDPGEN